MILRSALAIAILAAPTVLRAGVSFSTYPTPTAGSEPFDIVSGPDGALWFTEPMGNKIGRITTSGVITEFSIPTAGGEPTGITAGPDGALWFVELTGHKIGRITITGGITEYPVPAYTGSSFSGEPVSITAGPDGALWFTELPNLVGHFGNIGRITTTGVITEYAIDFYPQAITAGPDGALWFTGSRNNEISEIGRITTAGAVTEYPTPTPNMDPPGAITTGPDGVLWFTELDADKIGRITTAGTITEYPVPTAISAPGGITTGPDGALWFTEGFGNKLARITTAGVITEYPITAGSSPGPITTGPDGALWFTESSFSIGRAVLIAYTCTNNTPPSITSIESASAYGGYSYFASGSWLEIKGVNLADPADPRLTAGTNPGQWTSADFNGLNAPTVLDGISVSVNGKPAYVWYLSPGQLNVQAPEDTATGNVAITVTNCTATSSPVMFTRRALAPGLLAPPNYTANGAQYMVATFASDGAYVLNTSTGAALGLNGSPEWPGDLIVAYGIGFGDVTPSILPGVIVGQSNAIVNPITLSFGSTPATLSYSGLAGSFVGLYEFYIAFPTTLASGDYPINVTQNGSTGPQTMYLTVHN